jgi:mono/diheme cytochrome c family protein
MRTFLTVVVVILFLILAWAGYLLWGGYNVAANVPHREITQWFLETVRERSIDFHSQGLSVPPLKDVKLAEIGLSHYHAMCRLCHGAPGFQAEEFARGLNPQPPHLASREVQELKDRELYWVVRNGIKMTGMPAFASTHTEKEILGLVAFSRLLPELTPEKYRSKLKAAGIREEEPFPHHR